jgi:hypothetical protein
MQTNSVVTYLYREPGRMVVHAASSELLQDYG